MVKFGGEECMTKAGVLDFQRKTKCEILIIKFTATWCGPCRTIKEDCLKLVNQMGDNVTFVEIDVDEYMELYGALKQKKQVNGIPAFLAFTSKRPNESEWFIPNDSHTGADKQAMLNFFIRCDKYAKAGLEKEELMKTKTNY